jgi:hypothetical protein
LSARVRRLTPPGRRGHCDRAGNAVAEALIDVGADTGMPGGSIGTPLANAVGYGCWAVARLLAARGARIETLWQAAALSASSKTRSP